MARNEFDANRYLADKTPVPFERPKAPRKWPTPKKTGGLSVVKVVVLLCVVWYVAM